MKKRVQAEPGPVCDRLKRSWKIHKALFPQEETLHKAGERSLTRLNLLTEVEFAKAMSSGELDVSLLVGCLCAACCRDICLSVLMSEFGCGSSELTEPECEVNSDTCRSETGSVYETAVTGGNVLVMTKIGRHCFRNSALKFV